MTDVTNRLRPLAAVCLSAIALLASSPEPADAASRLCRQLEAQLASGGSGSPAKARKYYKAIAEQRAQIDRARGQERDACRFTLFGAGRCGEVRTTIDRMVFNLESLEQERAGMGGGLSRRERTRILASLDANGCRGVEPALPEPVEVKQRNAELLQQVFNGLEQEEPFSDDLYEEGERKVSHALNPTLPMGGLGGSYRTLCVRSCDGYFFPISNASTRLDFDRDQKNCEATCPGADVQVFYHKAEGEDSAEMVSARTGLPYSQMETAYLYKDVNAEKPPLCGCAAQAKNFTVIAGRTKSDGMVPLKSVEASPAVADEQPAPKPFLPPPPPSGERKVRVVGPTFLPAREAAAGRQVPGPTQVR